MLLLGWRPAVCVTAADIPNLKAVSSHTIVTMQHKDARNVLVEYVEEQEEQAQIDKLPPPL